MAKHLRERDIQAIIEILDGWQGPLTWNSLIDRISQTYGLRPSRQTLHRIGRVSDAFARTKARIRLDEAVPSGGANVTLKAALDRMARLTNENLRLREENERLLERFITWQYNAYSRGLTEEDLNRGLPTIDKRDTK